MKYLYFIFLTLILIGCSQPAPPIYIINSPVDVVPSPVTIITQPATDDIMHLAKTSGCLICHNINDHRIGPAWSEVSLRYKGVSNAKQTLINKVKTGGSGNWTNITGGMPMPAYSPRVTDDDIEKLVQFILDI